MIRLSTSSRGRRSASAGVAGRLALGALLAAAPAGAAGYDDYHDLSEVEARLRAWDARPEVDLVEIGRSAGGRPIWVLRLAGDAETPPDERPAVFVGANVTGYHNAGTEAALDLIATLLDGELPMPNMLAYRTWYVAPVLNPDAHDALFAPVRAKRSGNGGRLDRDRDGFEAEDGPDDLDGDGRITRMRIADPAGRWLPHPEEPRVMVQADAMKERAGAYRIVSEGRDDDGDGEYNEDPAGGVAPDRNFAHAFPHPEPEAGPWPSYAPETRAVMDFLLAHRNIAFAVVYGPANNLLAKPQSLGGGGGDLGTQEFTVPKEAAEFLGLDPEEQYTIDEVWDVAKDLAFVIQNNITKDQLAQFLGAGPATQVADEDMKVIDHLAKAYAERLEAAGLAKDRPGEQYGKGGLTPWLYYHYGVMALELDVWGVPKAKKAEEEKPAAGEEPLTLERLRTMSAEEVVALGEETIQAFLDENEVPSQYNASMVISALESGQMTPERMAAMMESMGAAGGSAAAGEGKGKDEDDAETKRAREVLAWVDANAPEAVAPWTEVTLPDGTRAEVGGLDPLIAVAPPRALLAPALEVHTATVLDAASKTARLEVLSLDVAPLGGGVVRVKAVAGNRGFLPTHTAMAKRAQTHTPIRLELVTGGGIELVTGYPAVTSERLEGSTGTLEGSWLVRAAPGATITVRVLSDNAGRDQESTTVPATGRKGA
ncbi:MAG TPA: M14 family metallopeptidase [Thermoanaerobaculia bacterium]|nr:M14 family metallopeptidase [Thermoanaerobaculia bacterium]